MKGNQGVNGEVYVEIQAQYTIRELNLLSVPFNEVSIDSNMALKKAWDSFNLDALQNFIKA